MRSITLKIPAYFAAAGLNPSPRGREIALRFGLPMETVSVAPGVRWAIAFPSLTLVTGASGSGKSTLLRRIALALPGDLEVATLSSVALPPQRAVVDCFGLPLERTMEVLTRAGLGEPRLWLRSPAQLSEGEQFRFRLGRLMAGGAQVLLADEFAAPLDRVTARAVAWQFGRFVRNSERAAIVATSHKDLAEDLQPTRHIRLKKS